MTILDKCILSYEWKLSFEKTTSQNTLQVYENKETKRRVFNIEYVIDSHKSQPDIKFNNIIINAFDKKNYINNIKISNQFPLNLRKGDNFDIIVEYEDYNLTYIDLVISIFMINNINSKLVELNFGYRKIITDEFIKKIDLSYLFLILFFIIFFFLLRKKFLVEENQFIKIHIDEIIQGKNAEKIFFVMGIVLTIFLFFIIIKFTYYITFIFSILLAILSVKSFYKYLLKLIFPSFFVENKYLNLKFIRIEFSNVIFYPMSIFSIIYWYYITDEYFHLHTFLNDIIFFIIVYFNVHKLNLKNFYVIMAISLIVIAYQIIKIIVDENIVQEDNNNVFYITTRFIIDVPIRFILKDLVDSPFEEIYFFSLLDIVLVGFITHYCEDTYHLSKNYLMISIYGTISGLIINMFIFYGFNFSPPISIIPLLINILSLLFYSIYKKQFSDFINLESKELQELKEIVKIQEIQDIPAQIDFLKGGELNISFNGEKLFEEEEKKDDELKDKIDESGKDSRDFSDSDDEENKKRHEKMINGFSDKIKFKRKTVKQEDLRFEGGEKLIDLVGNDSGKKMSLFTRKGNKKLTFEPIKQNNFCLFNKKKEPKIIEMKIFEEK